MAWYLHERLVVMGCSISKPPIAFTIARALQAHSRQSFYLDGARLVPLRLRGRIT